MHCLLSNGSEGAARSLACYSLSRVLPFSAPSGRDPLPQRLSSFGCIPLGSLPPFGMERELAPRRGACPSVASLWVLSLPSGPLRGEREIPEGVRVRGRSKRSLRELLSDRFGTPGLSRRDSAKGGSERSPKGISPEGKEPEISR